MIRLKPRNPGPLWKLFSSVWLAVGLMLSIATMALVGHVLGIKETEEVFFGSWWFSSVMVLLGCNITVCTLSRSPWRLSQIPFLIVHTGLLLIIAAGIWTRFKQDGQLAVEVGSRANELLTEERELVIEGPSATGAERIQRHYDIRLTHLPQTEDLAGRPDRVARIGGAFFLGFAALGSFVAWRISGIAAAELVLAIVTFTGLASFIATRRPWSFQAPDGKTTVTIERYYPHHDVQERFEQDPRGQGPAVGELLLRHPTMGGAGTQVSKLWVTSGDRESWRQQGRFAFTYTRVKDARELDDLLSGAQPKDLGTAVFTDVASKKTVRVALPDGVGRPVELEGWKITVTAVVRNVNKLARGEGEAPDEAPLAPVFVAEVQQLASGPGVTPAPARRLVCGRRPKNPHGSHGNDHASIAADYDFPNLPASPPLPEFSVNVIAGPEKGQARLLIKKPDLDRALLPLRANDFVKLVQVMPALELSIGQMFDSAVPREDVVPLDADALGPEEKAIDALYVKVKDVEGRAVAGWISTRPDHPALRTHTAELGAAKTTVSYVPKRIKLPFEIELRKFTIEKHEGSNQPAGYQSDVTVHDKTSEIPRYDYQVYMNHTLVHRGWTFFQSSFIQQPGAPEISIFAVSHDPGGILFYLGSIVLCLGVVVIFWVKPTLREIEKRRAREAAGTAAPAAAAPAAAAPAAAEPKPETPAPETPKPETPNTDAQKPEAPPSGQGAPTP